MNKSLHRLEKENDYIIGHFFVGLAILSLIIALFRYLPEEDGSQKLADMFSSFNLIETFLLVALFFYIRYLIAMYWRRTCLTKGIRYEGEIIDEIYSHFRNTRYVQYRIRYDGYKEYLTPKYDEDFNYVLTTDQCSVYVYNGKCYADDFDFVAVEELGNVVSSVRNIEKYLVDAIGQPGFNRGEFISERKGVQIDKSKQYILCSPMAVKLSDGAVISFIIDIHIQADKPTTVFSEFDQELRQYILEEFVSYSSSDSDIMIMKNKLQEEVYTKCRRYYYFVEILDVKVGVI